MWPNRISQGKLLLSWYKVYQQRIFAQRLQPWGAKAKPFDKAEIKGTGTEKKRRREKEKSEENEMSSFNHTLMGSEQS